MNRNKINKNKTKYALFFIVAFFISLFLINNYFLDKNNKECKIVENTKICYKINLFKS
jgi:hypothetical protein